MAAINSVYIIFISTMIVVGILAGAFIATFSLWDLAKGRSLNTCDRIILALAISSSCLQASIFGDAYFSNLWREVHCYAYSVIKHLKLWCSLSSNSLTACLCVFYCVKIVDFTHPLWIRVKVRVTRSMTWMIVGSVVASLVLSFSSYSSLYRCSEWNSTANFTFYKNVSSGVNTRIHTHFFSVGFLGACVPLLLAAVSIILILISLCRHTRRMKENASGFSQPRLEAHFEAARMVGSLLLLNIVLLVEFCVRITLPIGNLLRSSVWITVALCYMTQSLILILGNTRLRNGFWKVLLSLIK